MEDSIFGLVHKSIFLVGLVLIATGYFLKGPTEEEPNKNINTKFYLKLTGVCLIVIYFIMIGYLGYNIY